MEAIVIDGNSRFVRHQVLLALPPSSLQVLCQVQFEEKEKNWGFDMNLRHHCSIYSRIKLKTETDVVAPKDLDMCRSQELDPSRPSRAERLRRFGNGVRGKHGVREEGKALLLMEEILHQLIWRNYHYLHGFIHLRWWGNKGWPFWGSEAENEQNLSSTTSYFQALAMNSLMFFYTFSTIPNGLQWRS